MTVGELMERMSAREFADWMFYDELSPIGPERAELTGGYIAATINNLFSKRRRKPTDYIYTGQRREPVQSLAAMKAAFRAAVGDR